MSSTTPVPDYTRFPRPLSGAPRDADLHEHYDGIGFGEAELVLDAPLDRDGEVVSVAIQVWPSDQTLEEIAEHGPQSVAPLVFELRVYDRAGERWALADSETFQVAHASEPQTIALARRLPVSSGQFIGMWALQAASGHPAVLRGLEGNSHGFLRTVIGADGTPTGQRTRCSFDNCGWQVNIAAAEALEDLIFAAAAPSPAVTSKPAARTAHRLATLVGAGNSIPPGARQAATEHVRTMHAQYAHRPSERATVAQMFTGPGAGPLTMGTTAGLHHDNAGWTSLGPHSVGGRTRAILFDPTKQDHTRMYAGAAGGGVWRSEDRGQTWFPTQDLMGNLAVASMAIDPTTGELFAGTGEGFENIGAIAGEGIFYSADGWSWDLIPETRVTEANHDFQFVNALAITSDGNVLLAGTRTGIHRLERDPGRSRGAEAWVRAPRRAVQSDAIIGSLLIDPKDKSQMRAIASEAKGGKGRIFHTTDRGTRWDESSVPAPVGATPGKVHQRISLCYAATNDDTDKPFSDVVYALRDNPDKSKVKKDKLEVPHDPLNDANFDLIANPDEILRSDDGGLNFTQQPSTRDILSEQGWYDNVIWAGDADNKLIVAGGPALFRIDLKHNPPKVDEIADRHSVECHSDHHALVSDPRYGDAADPDGAKRIWVGNDGGVYSTKDITTVGERLGTTWEDCNTGYGVTQFYAVAANKKSVVIAGAQDNGTRGHTPGEFFWDRERVSGGDGGHVAVVPTDDNRFFVEYINGTVMRTERSEDIAGAAEWASLIISGPLLVADAKGNPTGEVWWWWDHIETLSPSEKAEFDTHYIPEAKPGNTTEFIAPFVLDPRVDPRVDPADDDWLLVGCQQLWRSKNPSAPLSNWDEKNETFASSLADSPSWQPIKPWVGEGTITAIALGQPRAKPRNQHAQLILVGHSNGEVYLSKDGHADGPTWEMHWGYTLQLKKVDTAEELPETGESLVIIAKVGSEVHIRIFDAQGHKSVDKTEAELSAGTARTSLKELVITEGFPDETSLTDLTKAKMPGTKPPKIEALKRIFITVVAQLVDYALPTRCNALAFDPFAPELAFYAGFGGFPADGAPGNLWKRVTVDGVARWEEISQGLPRVPVLAITLHPKKPGWVYLGMQNGVFASDDGGDTWAAVNEGPANVPCYGFDWIGQTLLVATHGRGVFQIDLTVNEKPERLLFGDASGKLLGVALEASGAIGGTPRDLAKSPLGEALVVTREEAAVIGAAYGNAASKKRDPDTCDYETSLSNRVFLGDAGGALHYLDAATLEDVVWDEKAEIGWKHTPNLGGRIHVAPTLWACPSRDLVELLVVTDGGWLHLLDPWSGALREKLQLEGYGVSGGNDQIWSCGVMDDWAYLTSTCGTYAVRLHPKVELAWHHPHSASAKPPLLAARTCFVGGSDGKLYALEARTGGLSGKVSPGRVLWLEDTGARITTAPVWTVGAVAVGNAKGLVVGCHHASGNRTHRKLFDNTPSHAEGEVQCLGADDAQLYWVGGGAQGEAQLHRLDVTPRSGDIGTWDAAEKWRSPLPGGCTRTPVICEEELYLLTTLGELHEFSSDDGRPHNKPVTLWHPEEKVNPVADMVRIPAGHALLGSPRSETGRNESEDDVPGSVMSPATGLPVSTKEGQQVPLSIGRAFWMGRYPVTVALYASVMEESAPEPSEAERPKETVSWTEALDFCDTLTKREREKNRIPAGWAYRLPTEAEWEYACRAGTTTAFSFGEDDAAAGYPLLSDFAWFADQGGPGARKVGQKLPNAWGLYDMHGNVWEWCQDRYKPSYPGGVSEHAKEKPWWPHDMRYRAVGEPAPPSWSEPPPGPPAANPGDEEAYYEALLPQVKKGPSVADGGSTAWKRYPIPLTACRVMRGGCWHDAAIDCRSSRRAALYKDDKTDGTGFRVVLARM